jgi:hypothetical protein
MPRPPHQDSSPQPALVFLMAHLFLLQLCLFQLLLPQLQPLLMLNICVINVGSVYAKLDRGRVQSSKVRKVKFRIKQGSEKENWIEINKYVYCELWNKCYGLWLIYTCVVMILVSRGFSVGHWYVTCFILDRDL